MRTTSLVACLLAALSMPPPALAQALAPRSPFGAEPPAPADGSPRFPDRRPGAASAGAPAPTLQLGDVRVGERGLDYQKNGLRERLDVRVEHNRSTGFSVGANYGRIVDERLAWGLNAQAAPDHVDLVVNGLYSLAGQWHLGASLGYLDREDTYSFYTGPARASAVQLSHRLSLNRSFDKDSRVTDVGVQWYGARVLRTDSSEAVVAEETATDLRWWLDPRRLAPGRLGGLGGIVGLQPWQGGRLRLSLGTESLRYAYADGSHSSERRVRAGVDLSQRLSDCWRIEGGLATGVTGQQVRATVGRGIWSVSLNRANGRLGLAGDTALSVNMNMPLGGRGRVACGDGAEAVNGPRTALGFDRLDQVHRRPIELPTTVLAKVDPTARPYVLAAFDKASLGNAQVSVTPEAMFIQLPQPVLSVAQLSFNGQPANNLGAQGAPLMAPVNGALRIDIRQFPNPGAGVSMPVQAVLVLAGGQVATVSFNAVGN